VPWAIITLPDNGAKIFNSLQEAGIQPQGGLHQVTSLAEAVALARELVPENGCVLLSPGAPSFPHFRDFEDRGNQFKTLSGIEKCN
jgi:UDP-N-acetylmuramoylalanine--D-glutamate ligase